MNTSVVAVDPHHLSGLLMQPGRNTDAPKEEGVLHFRASLHGDARVGFRLRNVPACRVHALEGYCNANEHCSLTATLRDLHAQATEATTCDVIDAVIDAATGRLGIWLPTGFREVSVDTASWGVLRAFA